MSSVDDNKYCDIFPVFCTVKIPAEVLNELLRKCHNAKNDWYAGGSFSLMNSETEDPYSIVRPTQPPVEAFESPSLPWSVKKVFKHFKLRYYEPFTQMGKEQVKGDNTGHRSKRRKV